MRVVVFASGGGSNFQALIDRFESGSEGITIAALIVSRAGAGAVDRARRHGVPIFLTDEAGARAASLDGESGAPRNLPDVLEELEADLIVLAGYLRLVPGSLVRAWWGRAINVHPALLPSFGGPGMYGKRVHEAVIASGARVTGVTVHFVDEQYDRGPIIAQWPVPVLGSDTSDTLAARVLDVEHRVLPDSVAALARGDVSLMTDGGVRWTAPWFRGRCFVMTDESRT